MSYLLNYKNWKALYESQTNIFEDEKDTGSKTATDPFADMPKDLDQRIKYLVNKAVDTDSAAVKAAGKSPSYWVDPWEAIMDWMYAKGDPGKETENVKKLIEYNPNYEKKIEDAKPTMSKAGIAKCMEHWHGIFNDEGKTATSGSYEKGTNMVSNIVDWAYDKGKETKNPQVEAAIDALTKLSDPAFVSKLIDKEWKKADAYPTGTGGFKILGKDVAFTGADTQFNKELIVEKSKAMLDKLTSVMKKTGKSPRTGLEVQYTINDEGFETEGYVTTDDKSMFLIPKLEFKKDLSQEEKDKLMFRERIDATKAKFSKAATASFFIWYSIISNEELFGKLTQRLEDPTYVKTNYVKMTEQDKINIITGILEISTARWAKSKSISPRDAIYWANSIMWWPVKAKETMPQTITVKPAGEGTEIEVENLWDFSWPYAKGAAAGKELAMTYFKSDQAVIQDGKDKEIDNAVKQIMAEIKSKNGTLKSLRYRIIASTSDEPSAYQANGTVGKPYLASNNNFLVKARAKVIEAALTSAITANAIDPTLVTKDGEDLLANNTMSGAAIYNDKKWMRLDHKDPRATAQTDAEYKALFAKPKHSGILFYVVYTTIEKDKGDPTPEETKVSDYEVVGEWLFQITWSGGGGYRRTKRYTRPRRPIRGINWDKLFPPMLDVLGVDDLCAAYG
jgi:hypothetical protein